MARDHGAPAALKKRIAAIKHHRRCQHALDPLGDVGADPFVDRHADMIGHLEQEDRQAQHQADPEPPGEVDQLRVARRLGNHRHGLQRHAADRAGAWLLAHDLRMHWAGVLGRRHRDRCVRFQHHAALRALAWAGLAHVRMHRAGVGACCLGQRRFRFQRHTALRAFAGARLAQVGMHRAGVHHT